MEEYIEPQQRNKRKNKKKNPYKKGGKYRTCPKSITLKV